MSLLGSGGAAGGERVLTTPRLLLRGWRAADREPFAALNADPRVMAHFPAPLSRAASDELAERMAAGLAQQGLGMWALEVRATGQFVGFTGLAEPRFKAAFLPAVEIGWRLAASAWGLGYATEAADAALDAAFGTAGLPEVVSFTATTNVRSQAVMRRLGMRHDPAADFDHPALPPGHPLRRHVLYRISASAWSARRRRPR